LGYKKNDPHQQLELLERWSGHATLIILAGIILEIGLLFWFPHDPAERVGGAIADVLIAAGLIAEYIVILRVTVATGEANRESDEKIAEAATRAAEANERAAKADLAR
jgi:hypothetical protein